MTRKILVSLPEDDLRVIDQAARRSGETRSAFIRRAALSEAERPGHRPADDPVLRQTLAAILRRAERRRRMTTAEALEARDQGRR